ncbi:hypothetical protein PR202_ga04118 [Eleusine coracana subsp. coracana]|uniref:Uncharacterized protein n=1 Tax=Eleusine coracana subsp. coracana TaxID=191504 RepID=A0AAV5BP66_ELECO|nr:hypothetical protein PR202_ga04118 [Eleusine coracana subsp. coracana]
MDADDETARMPTRPAGETRPLTQEYLIEHRQRQEAEAEAKRELSQAAEWAEMDSGTHEELSDWMSQLFEKLDLEVNEDNICSTGNVTEVEAHPVAEEVISSKIQMAPKLKDSSMVEMDARSPEEKITDWLLKL